MTRIWSTPVSFPFDKEQLLAIVGETPLVGRPLKYTGCLEWPACTIEQETIGSLIRPCCWLAVLCAKKRAKCAIAPDLTHVYTEKHSVDFFLFPFSFPFLSPSLRLFPLPCSDFLDLICRARRNVPTRQLNFQNPKQLAFRSIVPIVRRSQFIFSLRFDKCRCAKFTRSFVSRIQIRMFAPSITCLNVEVTLPEVNFQEENVLTPLSISIKRKKIKINDQSIES